MMNKSLITNLLAAVILIFGLVLKEHVIGKYLLTVGVFALAGAITNWLAVHMLFEKVPLLYGSGVVPNRFEDFKRAIKSLIMTQFFSSDNVSQFFEAEKMGDIDMQPVIDSVDYDRLFDKIVEAILNSSFGSLLGMVGGEKALTPLREPIKEKLRDAITEISKDEKVIESLKEKFTNKVNSGDVVFQIEMIVDKRLDELTPQMVKEIVQKMIKNHLGWLVVWGGIFGGLIGLIAEFVNLAP